MNKKTEQLEVWSGEFGKEYTDRNAKSLDDIEQYYIKNFGLSRIEMNRQFLGDLSQDIRILEVGSNVGNQLLCLQKMGFSSLYGIEIQSYAVEMAKQRTKNINIIQGSAFDIPFKDGFFDLVFTSGVLIHIAPSDIQAILKEIHRCSKKYIWGYEYYADSYTEIEYRGEKNLLWKTNFSQLFLDSFQNLKLVKQKIFPYAGDNKSDVMYLLEKSCSLE